MSESQVHIWLIPRTSEQNYDCDVKYLYTLGHNQIDDASIKLAAKLTMYFAGLFVLKNANVFRPSKKHVGEGLVIYISEEHRRYLFAFKRAHITCCQNGCGQWKIEQTSDFLEAGGKISFIL